MNLDNLPVGQEDIILLIFVAGILIAAAAIQTGSTGGKTPSFCQKWANATENNLSKQYGSVSCRCEDGEKYKKRLDTPKEVKQAANLHVINCKINDRELIFPVWRINKSKVNTTGNVTWNGSARVVR
ncbi:MAG: hypothetical protein SVU32_09460 [Candidatus Nanohaloarchaea archaeon]|nr:hypothetical protein [Candidatus Nanohaloarchaea archaeon]